MPTEPLADLMKRWTEARERREYLDRLEGFRIADHACHVLPKVREALLLSRQVITDFTSFTEKDSVALRSIRDALALLAKDGEA